MNHIARLLVGAALTLAVAAPASTAHAQATLAPLFTVAGVINTGSFGTYFACTNTDTSPVSIGVEVFDQGGTSTNNPATPAAVLGRLLRPERPEQTRHCLAHLFLHELVDHGDQTFLPRHLPPPAIRPDGRVVASSSRF
jgi:hypothetical protein